MEQPCFCSCLLRADRHCLEVAFQAGIWCVASLCFAVLGGYVGEQSICTGLLPHLFPLSALLAVGAATGIAPPGMKHHFLSLPWSQPAHGAAVDSGVTQKVSSKIGAEEMVQWSGLSQLLFQSWILFLGSYGGSQLCLTPVSRDLTNFLALSTRHITAHTYMQTKYQYT